MIKKIKRHFDIAIVMGIGLSLLIVAMIGMYGKISVNYVSATTDTDQVTVQATISEWISISVSPSSATLTPALVDTAGDTAVGSTTDITVDIGTNATSGWSVSIEGANAGLLSDSNLIATVSPTSTLTDADDVDGYGANATDTLAGVNIKDNYAYWGTKTVGEIASTTASTMADKNTPNSSGQTVVTMKVMAECDGDQPAGIYSDTITLTATGGT